MLNKLTQLTEKGLQTIRVIKKDGSLNKNLFAIPLTGLTLASGYLAVQHQDIRTKEFESRKLDERLQQLEGNRIRNEKQLKIKPAPFIPQEEKFI